MVPSGASARLSRCGISARAVGGGEIQAHNPENIEIQSPVSTQLKPVVK
jgi:hypothetical protein